MNSLMIASSNRAVGATKNSEWGLLARSAEVLHQHEVHVRLVLLRI
jgi:hypothetical protein